MGISGPLSLFRKTLKYGRALATFFPTLTATHSFSLAADCRLRQGASGPSEPEAGEGAFGEQAFVPFRKRVDVRALLRAAEGVARRSDRARVPGGPGGMERSPRP